MSRDSITAFRQDGIRWALHALSDRAEIASVMEEMLDTIEHWKLVNDMESYRLKVQEKNEEISRLSEAIDEMKRARAEEEKEQQFMKDMASDLRNRLVEDIIRLSKELKTKETLQKKLEELQSQADSVPKLEKDLHKAQKELKEAKILLKERRKEEGQKMETNIEYEEEEEEAFSNKKETISSSSISLKEENDEKEKGKETAGPRPVRRTLMDLEEGNLLQIFTFLSTPDVLSIAGVSRSFYEQIGEIFGAGKTTTSPDAAPTATIDQTGRRHGSSVSSSSSSSLALALAQSGSSLLASSSSFLKTLGLDELSLSFSSPPPSTASAAAKSVLAETPITDKIASSITSKLSGAELKGILGMTEKLKKMENILMQMQTENEDLRARFQGMQSVKDFLLSKLKETEVALKNSLDQMNDFIRQHSSDQEVISFLDERVQELETSLTQTADKLYDLQEQSKKDKLANQEQTRVLQDMLHFEKQKTEDIDIQFRQQKKLLVKEIKRLQAVLRERDTSTIPAPQSQRSSQNNVLHHTHYHHQYRK